MRSRGVGDGWTAGALTFGHALQQVSPRTSGHLRSAAASSVRQPPQRHTGASAVQHGAGFGGSSLQQLLGPHATNVAVPALRQAPSQQKKPSAQHSLSGQGPSPTSVTPVAHFSSQSLE